MGDSYNSLRIYRIDSALQNRAIFLLETSIFHISMGIFYRHIPDQLPLKKMQWIPNSTIKVFAKFALSSRRIICVVVIDRMLG
jgi:hypothetical protein